MFCFCYSIHAKNKWLLCSFLAIFFFSCKNQSPAAQGTEPASQPVLRSGIVAAALKDSMTRFLDTFLQQQHFSGGMLVVKNNQTIYERYMGFSDIGMSIPVTDTTPFHVASTSKTITSTAVLQLIAIGKLSLSDSLTKFFPQFPYPGITVRHLLTHTSGLRNYAYFFPQAKWNIKVTANNQDVLNVLIKNKPLPEFPVGSKFHYSNTNFSLLALLVEEISKLSFPLYVQQYIFGPSGMTRSYILGTHNMNRYMPSWRGGGRLYPFEYLDAIYGDKNLYTTCTDLRRYDSAISHNLLLPQALYDSAWQPLYADRHYRDTFEFYGLGWRVKQWTNGNKIVYHNGWWHGNNAVFQRVFQDSAVIIVTGNVFNSNLYKLGRVANFFRPYYEQPNTTTEQIPETEDPSAKPSDTVTPGKTEVKPKLPEKKVKSKK